MADQVQTYDISTDTLNGRVATRALRQEIASSNIIAGVRKIETIGGSISDNGTYVGGTVNITFKNTLTTSEETILDGVLANHAGSPTDETIGVSIKDEKINTVSQKPTQSDFERIYIFSCDMTKKETWYVDSLEKVDSFSANGVQKTFDLTEGSGVGSAVIDLSHGKVTDENLIVTPSGTSYIPVVKINGAMQNERECYESSGGHYTIDYKAGKLTFFSAPPSGNNVSIQYHYSPSGAGPIILGGPPAGKKWIIDVAEVQFSKDVVMNDTLVQNVLVDVPIFDASGNYLFTAYDQKAATDAEYKNIGTFLDYTYGSFSTIPAFGGPQRGTQNDTILLRWDYVASIELPSSLNARMKVWCKHNRGFGGERAVVTLYGKETDE